jgi:hypothetical protein
MGNCGACCGKADTNEIITEKHQKQKGVNNANDLLINDIKTKEK